MISTDLGSEEQVIEELKDLPQTLETYMVYGIFDIIAKIEFADREELRELVIKIRGIHRIKATTTLET
jgi:DNA-binding Lrp family transcriptional regulator